MAWVEENISAEEFFEWLEYLAWKAEKEKEAYEKGKKQ